MRENHKLCNWVPSNKLEQTSLPPSQCTTRGKGWHIPGGGVDFGPYLLDGPQGWGGIYGGVEPRSRCSWNHWSSNTTTWGLFQRQRSKKCLRNPTEAVAKQLTTCWRLRIWNETAQKQRQKWKVHCNDRRTSRQRVVQASILSSPLLLSESEVGSAIPRIHHWKRTDPFRLCASPGSTSLRRTRLWPRRFHCIFAEAKITMRVSIKCCQGANSCEQRQVSLLCALLYRRYSPRGQ